MEAIRIFVQKRKKSDETTKKQAKKVTLGTYASGGQPGEHEKRPGFMVRQQHGPGHAKKKGDELSTPILYGRGQKYYARMSLYIDCNNVCRYSSRI